MQWNAHDPFMAIQSSCSQTNMGGKSFNADRSAGSPLGCCQLRKERCDEDHGVSTLTCSAATTRCPDGASLPP